MTKSLQDQLLGAGLIDKKKAKKLSKSAKKDKYQKERTGQDVSSEAAKLAQKAQKEKQERDRLLNLERKAAEEQKALYAQVKQLVSHYREKNRQGDVEFNFNHNGKIKKILLTKSLFEKVSCGVLSLVCLEGVYDLVPRPVAEKIRERMPDLIVVDHFGQTSEADSDDDYYADFEIPDDLMW